jgi:Nickel responsive protein SCO4226-like
MEIYAITRRHGWRSASALNHAVVRSHEICEEEMADRVRWIRSYVLEECDGSMGTICLFAAVSPEAIRKHARIARLPLEQIIRISDAMIVPPTVSGHVRPVGLPVSWEDWPRADGALR